MEQGYKFIHPIMIHSDLNRPSFIFKFETEHVFVPLTYLTFFYECEIFKFCTHWIFVSDWNAFIYVAAQDAALKWLGEKAVRKSA